MLERLSTNANAYINAYINVKVNGRVIKGAAKNAFLAWIVIYLFLFMTLLGYRFSTRQYYLHHSAKVAVDHAETVRIAREAVAAAEASYTTKLEEKKIKAAETPPLIEIIKPPPVIKTVIHRVQKENPLQGLHEPAIQLVRELSTIRSSLSERIKIIEDGLLQIQQLKDHPVWRYDVSSSASSSSSSSSSKEPQQSQSDPIQSLADSWKRLMVIPSVGVVSEDDLHDTFGTVKNHISHILIHPPDDWTSLHEIFTNEEIAVLKKDRRELICPIMAAVQTDKDNYNSTATTNEPLVVAAHDGMVANAAAAAAVTIHDMEEHIVQLESLLSRRVVGAGIDALMPSTMLHVEDILHSKIQVLVRNIHQHVESLEQQLGFRKQQQQNAVSSSSSSSSDGSTSSSSCFDPKFVTALVHAGLLAMAAHADVRDALQKTTVQWVPTLSDDTLILDADLPSVSSSTSTSSSTNARRGQGANTKQSIAVINVRSILDSPLLTQTVGWLDQLVELLGGYNDEVDRYLDSLTVGPGGRDVSVGEVVVESLLQYAGMVGDIDLSDVVFKFAEKLPRTSRQKILNKL
jgi:hypothetical protein